MAAVTYAAGLAASNQIVVAEIQQRAVATAQCGNPSTDLIFAGDTRVALFVRQHVPLVVGWAAIAAGTIAALFTRDRPSKRSDITDTEADILIGAVLSSGMSVSDVIQIINGLKTN